MKFFVKFMTILFPSWLRQQSWSQPSTAAGGDMCATGSLLLLQPVQHSTCSCSAQHVPCCCCCVVVQTCLRSNMYFGGRWNAMLFAAVVTCLLLLAAGTAGEKLLHAALHCWDVIGLT
jgi:hypothetical protein